MDVFVAGHGRLSGSSTALTIIYVVVGEASGWNRGRRG